MPPASDKTKEIQSDVDLNYSKDITKQAVVNEENNINVVPNNTKVDESNKTKSAETSKVTENISTDKKKTKVNKPIEPESAPFDGDKNFDDLYLAIKMEASREQCSILVFVGVSTLDIHSHFTYLIVCRFVFQPG